MKSERSNKFKFTYCDEHMKVNAEQNFKISSNMICIDNLYKSSLNWKTFIQLDKCDPKLRKCDKTDKEIKEMLSKY